MQALGQLATFKEHRGEKKARNVLIHALPKLLCSWKLGAVEAPGCCTAILDWVGGSLSSAGIFSGFAIHHQETNAYVFNFGDQGT